MRLPGQSGLDFQRELATARVTLPIVFITGITETTVKVHRSNAMRKIKASSLAELCRMVDRLNLPPQSSES